MVVNPSNGPGAITDPNYASGIGSLGSAGISMVGYVYTGYGSRPLAEVEADLSSWARLYSGISGIFVDNMANEPGLEPYHSSVTACARWLGYNLVLGNPGTAIPEPYLGTLDATIIYENGGFPPISRLDPHGSYAGHPAKFGIIVHDVVRLDPSFVGRVKGLCEYISVTDSYHAIPTYFEQLASLLSS